jgi:hypothetical protein
MEFDRNSVITGVLIGVAVVGLAATAYYLASGSSETAAAPIPVVPQSAAKGHTVKQFADLITKHAVPVDNTVIAGPTDYPTTATPERLYTGTDDHSRVFINLPLSLIYATGGTRVISIMVFQRYTDDDGTFCLSGDSEQRMCREDLLHDIRGCTNFQKLNILLSGGSLRFYNHTAGENGVEHDLNDWVDVKLTPKLKVA